MKVLSRIFATIRLGSVPILVLIGVLTLALTVGSHLGLGGIGVGLEYQVTVLGGLLVLYVVGLVEGVRKRQRLRRDAFVGGRPLVAEDADPIKEFFVRPWYGRASMGVLPPFVARQAMGPLMEGLDKERFVILIGQKTSGKSRLVLEAAKARTEEMTMVAVDAPAGEAEDPLIELMKDRRAFSSWQGRQTLFLRDLAKRVVAGGIDAASMRTWLERHPKIAVIATLDPQEAERVEAAGEAIAVELEMLEARARVVHVPEVLGADELARARTHPEFADADEEQLRRLPSYLASAGPLRTRLVEGVEQERVGYELVCAVADWWRIAGRPAPEAFLRAVAVKAGGGEAAFAQGLRWALEPVRGAATPIYRSSDDAGEFVFEPDRVVLDLFDGGRLNRPVPESAWRAAIEFIRAPVSAGEEKDEVAAEQLIAVAESALERSERRIAKEALEYAGLHGSIHQQQQVVRMLVPDTGGVSEPKRLVTSRRGDGFGHRLQPVKDLAEGRHFRLGDPVGGSDDGPSPIIAAIYRRHSLRTLVRSVVLVLMDVFSAGAGLALGLVVRELLAGGLDLAAVWDMLAGSLFAMWGAAAVAAFYSVGLYKKDAPRARLSTIAPAIALLSSIGLIATLADSYHVLVALAAAAAGGLLTFGLDFGLRLGYDRVSRKWVIKHSLEVHTLLIGSGSQAAMLKQALKEMSRPTEVVGYLSTVPDAEPQKAGPEDEDQAQLLGSVENLVAVATRYGVGRVILADPDIDPRDRQDLADLCHARGLLVEAVASLTDIRTGSTGYTPGQQIILVPLHPLWQRNVWLYAKRAMDIALALAGLILFAIPIAIIAIRVWLEERPVIVKSWRPGLGGDAFLMLRFRTTAGDHRPRIDLGEAGDDEFTTLGKCLSNRGLDELPQLVNVLLGHMSLVGPRPLHLRYHVRLEDSHLLRYVVRPGVTGPWQVCPRPILTLSELTALDVAYLSRWSIFTDLEILFRTAKLMLFGRETVPAIADGSSVAERLPA